MSSDVWLSLSPSERNLLREALATLSRADGADRDRINAMSQKIVSATPYPDITIGVYGAKVQITSRQQFPLEIIDYVNEQDKLPITESSGRPCRIYLWSRDA